MAEDKRILLQNAGVLLSQVDGRTWVSFPDTQGELQELCKPLVIVITRVNILYIIISSYQYIYNIILGLDVYVHMHAWKLVTGCL